MRRKGRWREWDEGGHKSVQSEMQEQDLDGSLR